MVRTRVGRLGVLLAGLATVAVGLAGCGSGSGGNGASITASPTPHVSVDTALAKKVPADIRKAGTIRVGSDLTYAPNEFLAADGKTAKGFDIDLFRAVAAKLGLKAKFASSKFDAIIPGVASGKYQIGVSSFTVNPERLKQVSMVTYFSAGTQWATQKGNPSKVDPGDACGKKVAVQKGTVQLQQDLPARQKACKKAGKPKIEVDAYQSQSDATTAVVSGKDQAMLADSPIVAYAVKKTNGKLSMLGDIYQSAPYGYVLPKDEADFGLVIAQAVKELMDDGTYDTILSKWGVQAGAIDDPRVNPDVK